MVYLYECLDAHHGVLRRHMHVGGCCSSVYVCLCLLPGEGGLRYFVFLHLGRLELLVSCGLGAGGA